MSNAGPEVVPNYTTQGITPSPWAQSTIWDTVYINSVPWWGKIQLRGAALKYLWDVKHSQGIVGFNQTYRGQPHKPFQIRFFIWTDSMYNYWVSAFQVLLKSLAGISLPVPISHPSLTNLSITTICIDELGAIEQVSDDMMFKVDVMVHQYLPPAPVPVTTTPASPAAPPKPKAGAPPAFASALAVENAAAQARQAAALGITLPF